MEATGFRFYQPSLKDELLDYFIHRQNVTGWSPATMRICYSGVKFFFKHVLKKNWHLKGMEDAYQIINAVMGEV